MKFRFTLYSVLSILIFLSGIATIFRGGNLAPLLAAVLIILAIILFCIYLILKAFFKKSYWKQLVAEFTLFILAYCIFLSSTNSINIEIHKPLHFNGYLYIVYNVEGKNKFKSPGLFQKVNHLTVPASGIVFASNPRPTSAYFNNTYLIIDSTFNGVKKRYPGYGVAFASDTLICNDQIYDMDVFYLGSTPPGWNFYRDTLNRNLKKDLACDLLNQK